MELVSGRSLFFRRSFSRVAHEAIFVPGSSSLPVAGGFQTPLIQCLPRLSGLQ
jgi:hypothetical protein